MKTILITGASSGFGFITTLLLARKGYTVYAGVRNLEKKESLELKEIAQKEHLSLTLIQLDVTKQSEVDALESIASKIDVLINNAGLGYLGAVEDYTIEEIKEQFEVNYFGTIRMIKAIVPSMRKRKSGLIINLSSISGRISFPLYGIYSSSKFAIEAMSEALRFELRPFNIQVALIEPGSFLTGFIKNSHFPKAQSDPNSPYATFTRGFFGSYKKFDNLATNPTFSKVFSPDKVAKRILKVIETPNSSFHNIVGKDAYILLWVNRILPRPIWNFFLKRTYKW